MSESDDFRTFVIVNPHSSNGATGRRWQEIEAALRGALGADVGHALTTRPQEATEITRRALRDGYEMVVAIGGDGTNNEVANGFFDEDGAAIDDDAVMGVFRAGTGGDFCRGLGRGFDLAGNLAVLRGRETRRIDLGKVTFVDHDGQTVQRHFLNITSFGVGGVVDDYVNRSTKALGGKASFFIGAFKAFLTYRNQHVTLRLDDGPPQELAVNNVAVANGQYFGGGMWVAPEASLDDGLFDVVTFGDLTKGEYLRLGGSIYKGRHLGHPKISHQRARTVVAESDERVLIDMDGEQPGRLPIRLEVRPAAVLLKV